MRRSRGIALVVVVVIVAATTFLWVRAQERLAIDLAASPPTVFTTVPFAVGDTYTLGSIGVPPEVKRPVTVTGATLVETSGVKVIGVGAFEPRPDGIGLVPNWPPDGVQVVDLDATRSWMGEVGTVIGLEVTAPKSGVRGIRLSWLDADGVAGELVSDLAVVTCSPGACPAEVDAESMLRELGLRR